MIARLTILAGALICANAASAPQCDWNNPGRAPLTIPSADAIKVYADIPAAERKDLQRKIAGLLYDDFVAITPDAIQGKYSYRAEIHDMLYSAGIPCRGISVRDGWAPGHVEYAFVYFVKGGPDIMVATSCRNPARVYREPPRPAAVTPPAPTTGFTPLPPLPSGGGLTIPPALLLKVPPPGEPLPPAILLTLDEPPPPPLIPSDERDAGIAPFGLPPVFIGGSGPVFLPVPPETDRPIAVVPEPATWALWLGGLWALGFLQRRRGAR